MSEADVAIIRKGLEAVDQGEFESFLSLTSPAISVYPRIEEPGVRDCYQGTEEMFEYLVNWFSGWDEYTVEPVSFIDCGTYVIVDMKEVGVTEASGMRVEGNFAHAFKVEDDKVVEWRMYGPVSEAMEALSIGQ